ncbi:MAG: PEP-CTERM sorting domain-containing protein [Bryobacterales bacterium]|nr:PEP-CTERM sorting domain-containing protein [Bryobacterales bacterium]
MKRHLALVFALFGAASLGSGAPIAYTINFTGGSPTPVGGFEYDSVTEQFQNFIVAWNGFTFDLTNSANMSFGADNCSPGAAEFFGVLQGTGCNPNLTWAANSLGTLAAIGFQALGPNTLEIAVGADGTGSSALPGFVDTDGRLSVSLAAVPEPSAWAMLVLGGGLLAAGRKRRGSAPAVE